MSNLLTQSADFVTPLDHDFMGNAPNLKILQNFIFLHKMLLVMHCGVCVQVMVPQLLYEYASSFMLVDGVRHLSHREAVLLTIKQLIPDWQSLTDQLTSGWHTLLFLFVDIYQISA